MLYAMLAYHVEAEVASWTAEEDAALMTELLAVHDRLNARKLLGPTARLGATADARRGQGQLRPRVRGRPGLVRTRRGARDEHGDPPRKGARLHLDGAARRLSRRRRESAGRVQELGFGTFWEIIPDRGSDRDLPFRFRALAWYK